MLVHTGRYRGEDVSEVSFEKLDELDILRPDHCLWNRLREPRIADGTDARCRTADAITVASERSASTRTYKARWA